MALFSSRKTGQFGGHQAMKPYAGVCCNESDTYHEAQDNCHKAIAPFHELVHG